MPNTNDRQFSYADPVLYNGSLFPSATANISDGGSSRVGKVFASDDGQYYYLNDSGTLVPAMLSSTLPEVTVTPSPEDMLASAFARRSTLSNDNTQVANTPHRPYNPHLSDNALRGAKHHALWEQQHPNAAAWGYAAAAIPFAIAAAPFVLGAGQAAAGTALGQAAIGGLEKLMTNPFVDATNTAIGAAFAVKGATDAFHGKFTPETALDIAGGAALGAKGILGLSRKYSGNGNPFDEFYLPLETRKIGAERYIDFIKSQEYQNRLKKAGMERYSEDIENLANERLNGINYFPGRLQETIDKNPNAMGLSGTGIFDPYRGITIKRSIYPHRAMPTLDHELSHWVTKSAGVEDKGFLGDIMRYNEDIAPNGSFTDFLLKKAKSNPKMKIPEGKELEKLEERYKYLTDPQEKRARAYSIYQQAKDNNMTTDEMVDTYTTLKGTSTPYTPRQLGDMTYIFTKDNLKKYLNGFLGLSAPMGIFATTTYNQNE